MRFVSEEKTILVDCDGVLLDWEYAFDVWMNGHGHEIKMPNEYKMSLKYGITDADKWIRLFNESAAIGFLPPLRDAIHYVRKLHEEHGFVFHAITSLSKDSNAQRLRTMNLQRLFGETLFERYVYLDTGADKDKELDEYKNSNCFWVEDKPENAIVGATRGLRSLLMDHPHNQEIVIEKVALGVKRVYNWKEIYNRVIGNA